MKHSTEINYITVINCVLPKKFQDLDLDLDSDRNTLI